LTVCASGCSATTIAAAIAAANSAGGDTISVTDAFHSEANITLDRDLTIQGQGASNTTVDGGHLGRVFTISTGVTATIQNLTIQNGYAVGGGGGGILNLGILTVNNSTITGNSTTYIGGGIFDEGVFIHGVPNPGELTINGSTISGNSAEAGGGIANIATMTLSNSTISSNSSSCGGGMDTVGTVTITGSTFSGNSAVYSGSGLINEISYSSLTATVINSTFSGDAIVNMGTIAISFSTLSVDPLNGLGGLANSGLATVKNSIIATTSGIGIGPTICSGFITTLGTNLTTDPSCWTNSLIVPPQLIKLGPLALNAPGTTETEAVLEGSSAIDAAADCTDVSGNPVTTDQRGVPRRDNGETACDIGAYEAAEFPSFVPFASFTAKLSLQIKQGMINLNSAFTLGLASNGIAPLTEDVNLQLTTVNPSTNAPLFATTISAGSFRQKSDGSFMYVGTINGVSIAAKITPQGGNSYTFQFTASGAILNSSVAVNPVKVTLTIDHNTGSTFVNF
jgi:hypothetical protein